MIMSIHPLSSKSSLTTGNEFTSTEITCKPRNHNSEISDHASLHLIATWVFFCSTNWPPLFCIKGFASFKIWIEVCKNFHNPSHVKESLCSTLLLMNKRPSTTWLTRITTSASVESSSGVETMACWPSCFSIWLETTSFGSVTTIFNTMPSKVTRHVLESCNFVSLSCFSFQIFHCWKKYFDSSSRQPFSIKILRVLSSAERWHSGGNRNLIISTWLSLLPITSLTFTVLTGLEVLACWSSDVLDLASTTTSKEWKSIQPHLLKNQFSSSRNTTNAWMSLIYLKQLSVQ